MAEVIREQRRATPEALGARLADAIADHIEEALRAAEAHGARAMREAVARWAARWQLIGDGEKAAALIRALPIPGE